MSPNAERRREGLGVLVMSHATSLVQTKFEMGAPAAASRWLEIETRVRDGVALVRTADEDDGIMVLRSGPSAGIDLAAPIVCERRPGDDW
jgi:hypothetical protein